MLRRVQSLLTALLLLSALGCAENQEVECEIDADCGDHTLICEASECRPRCANVECDPGQECEPGTGECVPIICADDQDCGHQELECRDAACVPRCDGVQCEPPYECQAATGECVGMACAADEDCGDTTYECRDGICTWKCENVQCPPESHCYPENGECYGCSECEENAHCPGGMQCIYNGCRRNECGPPDRPTCQGPSDCDAGHDCVETPIGSYCLKRCSSWSDCPDTRCEYDYPEYMVGYCYPRQGQPAEYFGPCDAHGEGDGVCVGPSLRGSRSLDDPVGLCTAKGEIENGSACSRSEVNVANPYDPSTTCEGVCQELEDGGYCSAQCIFFGENPCSVTEALGPTTCYPHWACGFGLCRELTEEMGREGDPCDPTYYEYLQAAADWRPGDPEPDPPSAPNPCVADTLCGEEGGLHTCMRACLTFVEEGEAACPDPDKTCVAVPFNPFLGICRCEEGKADCGEGCVSLDTVYHCGACELSCPSPPNAQAVCDPVEGCTFECDEGYSNCDGNPSTGCETEGGC
ncbi:MAG: hypothetical protein ACOC0J_02630 [Myxococcota bacterium]